MSLTLDEERITELISYVDCQLRQSGCDHSHRFTAEWARKHAIDWDDLLDALESRGMFCDCEVVLNLEESPLVYEPTSMRLDVDNRWLLPPGFSTDDNVATSKLIVSRAGLGRNNYTQEGEWLVPAPFDAKPRKRIRKSVHYFIGMESGLPTEIGFVADVEPMSISRFAHAVKSSSVPELQSFDRRVAVYLFQKVSKLPDGTPVGTNVAERVGVSAKHRELNIHRVILGR